MKKRFLVTLLTTALAFGMIVQPTAYTQAQAALNISDELKTKIKDMSNEELVKMLDELYAADLDYEAAPVDDVAAMLYSDCTFMTGYDSLISMSMEGGAAIWLNPAIEEVLRQRLPERFENIPSPLCVFAGDYYEDGFHPDYDLMKDRDDERICQPDFAKILTILERGPYMVDVTGTITTDCTKNIKTGKKYTITADYKTKASDNGNYDLKYVKMLVEYSSDQPTKLEVSLYSDKSGEEINHTFKLKMPKSLQKKIKSGKVILSAANASTDAAGVTRIFKDTAEKSGRITLSFKFKAK